MTQPPTPGTRVEHSNYGWKGTVVESDVTLGKCRDGSWSFAVLWDSGIGGPRDRISGSMNTKDILKGEDHDDA